MRHRNEKFYWTYQHSVGWPDDFIGPDSMTGWIIEHLRAYMYLILSSRDQVRNPL